MEFYRNNKMIFNIGLLFFGIILISSLGVNSVSAANSSTVYVSNDGNNSYDGFSSVYNGTSGPKATILNATGTVAINGIIYIAKGTYNEHEINLTHNMTIIGENQKNT